MDSSKSYCLIVNKASNSGRALSVIQSNWDEIQAKLQKVELVEIDAHQSIIEITTQKSASFDVIVACGGDGTARNVAIGLIGSNTLFGLLPIGTGNDFAKMLGLSKSFSENLDILIQNSTQKLDVIRFNDSFFINTLGIGFDGRTNHYASRLKFLKGSSRYVLAGIQSLFTAKAFQASIELEGESHFFRTMMIIVANGKWEGGRYLVSPDSENNDGVFEIIILLSLSKLRLALEFIRLSLGLEPSKTIFKSFKSQKANINTSKSVFIHADGEGESQTNFFKISLLDKSLNVICSSL